MLKRGDRPADNLFASTDRVPFLARRHELVKRRSGAQGSLLAVVQQELAQGEVFGRSLEILELVDGHHDERRHEEPAERNESLDARLLPCRRADEAAAQHLRMARPSKMVVMDE